MKILATLAVINRPQAQDISGIDVPPFQGTAVSQTEDEINVANQAEITDFYVKPSDAVRMAEAGFNISSARIITAEDGYEEPDPDLITERGLTNYDKWRPLVRGGPVTVPYFVHNTASSFHTLIQSSLSSLENDLGCFSIPEVSDSEIDATAFVNGIVFVGHNDGCYSGLGLAPGAHFQTLGVSTIESFGVPSGWQVIALAPGCTPDNPSTVQHEMLHALGVKHEHQRPDRDRFIVFDPSATKNPSQFDVLAEEDWYDMRSPLEIESVMTYCSFCGNNGADPVMTLRETGETWSSLRDRITTTDAKQLQHAYCELDPENYPDFEYKQAISCLSGDTLNVTREVFADRLCDGIIDCGGGEDETGELAKCIPKEEDTSNGCCGSITFENEGECISTGELYSERDVYECPNAVIAWLNGKGF
ncbi:unnamed protein product [Oikopleura dioica]|uniref:Peptidase M12A domain-containing protein n=1 Tax=Oikopleura dioica TaxID=34765 RepID=E4YRH3_OIKDI|nr:unnamed protein product [Oikopleura dioica]CBY38918.1 unnamed protein product [Oikopleura dioica]